MSRVTTPDGRPENFILKVGGKSFRCECGCNVFQKPDASNLEMYECNGCGATYEADAAQQQKETP